MELFSSKDLLFDIPQILKVSSYLDFNFNGPVYHPQVPNNHFLYLYQFQETLHAFVDLLKKISPRIVIDAVKHF